MTSKTYCPLPYMHQYIGSTGHPTPCCHVFEKENSWRFANYEKGLKTRMYDIMRQQMKDGHWPLICKKCKVQEERNTVSHRQLALERFGYTEEIKINSKFNFEVNQKNASGGRKRNRGPSQQ